MGGGGHPPSGHSHPPHLVSSLVEARNPDAAAAAAAENNNNNNNNEKKKSKAPHGGSSTPASAPAAAAANINTNTNANANANNDNNNDNNNNKNNDNNKSAEEDAAVASEPLNVQNSTFQSSEIAIVWFRRDLRVDDNPALSAAAASGFPVLPVFIWEPEEQGQFRPGMYARWWLSQSLFRLEENLRDLGTSRMTYLRANTASRALLQLREALGENTKCHLFFNNLYDAISLARDAQLKVDMIQRDIPVSTFNADLLYEPWEVLGANGARFTTFEEFWKCLRNLPYAPTQPQPSPASLKGVPHATLARVNALAHQLQELSILSSDEALCMEALEQRWRPGSRGAQRLFESFCRHALDSFSWERAKVDTTSTSQLSPHLHLGEISVRRIYYRIVMLQNECEKLGGGAAAPVDVVGAAAKEGMDGNEEEEEAEAEVPHEEEGADEGQRESNGAAGNAGAGASAGAGAGAGAAATATTTTTTTGGTIVGGLSAGGNAGAPRRMLDGSHTEYLRCLGLREWSRYLSFFYPFTHQRSLLSQLRAVPWNYDQNLFHRWKTGATGYPLVDAAMRQLWSTGWLHNRMRMVVASFLVKHLLLPWQWGLRHFWESQLDADLECDVLGWQYVSGCLADGHSFMIQIDLQSEARRFDPKGNYVRRWIAQLSRLPAKYIHAPWLAPPEVLAAAGVQLGSEGGYPLPVVDPADSRERLQRAVEHLRRMATEMSPPSTEEADDVPAAQSGDLMGERGGTIPRDKSGSPEDIANSHAAGGDMSPTAAKRSEEGEMDGIDFGKGTLPPTLRDVHDDMSSIDKMNKRKRLA